MSLARILLAILLSCTSLGLHAETVTLIHAGQIMAVPGDPVIREGSIVIRNGKISEVLPRFIDSDQIELAEGDKLEVQDLKNLFVLPGLIDGHVHLSISSMARYKFDQVELSDADIALQAAHYAKLLLQAGFTSVRDLASFDRDAIFALRDAIKKGYVPGPRIFAAGHIISPTGGHAQAHGYNEPVYKTIRQSGACDGVAECRKAVRDQIRRGADQIKFVATGGVLSETAAGTGQQFFDDEIKAIVDTAHALGRKVTAHAHDLGGVNAALRAGADAIEHGTFANKESHRLFKQSGAYLIPTLMTVKIATDHARDPNTLMPEAVRSKALSIGPYAFESMSKAHKAGVKFAFGTDSGVFPHGINAGEFALLQRIGMTASESIQTATINGADNLGQLDTLGTIEPGKYADLIAVEGDPLQNVNELDDVDFVMKGGVVYKQATGLGIGSTVSF